MNGHKIVNQQGLYYLTLTTVGWIDIFTRKVYREILLDSFRYCQASKGLVLYAYVIMGNHVHIIAQAETPYRLSDILRDFKKYTARQILAHIQTSTESRKDWLLHVMRYYAKFNKNNRNYQCWQNDNHPVELVSPKWIAQKLNYIHLNPVRADWVDEAEQYRYSSARSYVGKDGLIEVVLLELPMSMEGYVTL